MDVTALFIGVALGAVVGGLVAWFARQSAVAALTTSRDALAQQQAELLRTQEAARQQAATAQAEAARATATAAAAQENFSTADRERLNLRAENTQLRDQLTAEQTERKAALQRLAEQQKYLEEVQVRMNEQFKVLANDILEDKSKKFTEQNKTQLDTILKPLGDKIEDFRKKVEEVHTEGVRQHATLQQQVKGLFEQTTRVSNEANALTAALKGEVKRMGTWGEELLSRLLEHSGLVRDRDYQMQASYQSEDGRRLQPDVVVNLPEDRHMVIDSKVSLVAYERYFSSEDKPAQDAALKEHIVSLRRHINDLSAKNYPALYDLRTLDFTILFVPIEPAYLVAVQADPNIWTEAYERRIILCSPTNLLAMLKIVANIWRTEYQSRNTLEIARQAGDLYDKFVALTEDLTSVGKQMDQAKKSYEAAMNKLSTGKGNLVGRVEKLKLLGVKTEKQMNPALLDRALGPDSDSDTPPTGLEPQPNA